LALWAQVEAVLLILMKQVFLLRLLIEVMASVTSTNHHCKEEGPYSHSQKFTLTAAIRGGPNGGCWIDVSLWPGTTTMDTYDFLQNIINQLGMGGINATTGTHTFICDNFTSHKSPIVHLLVNSNQHRLIFRAPYYPCDGPIEYFFNHLQQQLSLEMYRVKDVADLQPPTGHP
jgi:hypothetical protein